MRTSIFFMAVFVAGIFLSSCGGPEKKISMKERTIVVTGSAEKKFTPDEIWFVIGIEEYWKEEFQRGKEFEDYKTKISIDTIENKLRKTLAELGVTQESITLENLGNYWRYTGKELLISKRFNIKLNDLDMVNKLMSNIDQKGVDYMRIDKKTHSQIEEYRKEIKKNALLAAKEKAAYLLEVLECEIGEVVSIKEINNDLEYNNYWWNPGYYSSNVSYQEQSPGTNEELEISLRYEVEAEFKIK